MAGEEIGMANFQVRAHAKVGLVRAEADHRVDSQLGEYCDVGKCYERSQ